MKYLILQGDEHTAAVAGFVNIEYHFLRFVLILKDGRHLPFFLRSLTLPARPRLNDFRWALLRTEVARSPYNAQLRRFCRFGYTIANDSLVDRFPHIKQLQDDACLRNLLRLHTQGTFQTTFYLEQCQANKWIPKNPTHSVPNQVGGRKQNLLPESTFFDLNPSAVDSSSTDATNNDIEKYETQKMSLSSRSSTSSDINPQPISCDRTHSLHHNICYSSSGPILVDKNNSSQTVPFGNFMGPQSTRFWTMAPNNGVSYSEYFPLVCCHVPSYSQLPWFISQLQ
ncbi:hypothetical protein GpartN1_g737.t1 [Galdieria partita]|uniref:Uncharacterized protein n=1 Tax=Galdieria partita TaxID=83374 RepID=A0A9C7PRA1_9RHOD|nr:hypothetical protein GpartN1_g737.t1 [Galdieria partita]